MSKLELAEAAGLSSRIITAYEAGEKSPSEETRHALAQVLGFPPVFFALPDVSHLDVSAPSFRSLSKMTAGQRDRALAGGELALELAAYVESRFTLPAADLPDLRGAEPEAAATALRVRWGLGDAGISHMVRLLEAKGVRVFSLAEDSAEVDAFSFWCGETPYVLLNTLKSAERSRFDAAHELGHLVLHRHAPPGGRSAEHEADEFASAFLMPRTSMLKHAPRFPSISTLILEKQRWRVSLSAFVHRLHKVGLLSEWQYRTLFVEIQKRGYRKEEPQSIERERSAIFQQILERLEGDGRSRREIAKDLGWPIRELNALVFGPVVGTISGGDAQLDEAPITSPGSKLRLMP
jgi:Zn-dependent peptidase ImmA (M78 family)/DNA-binding XRE family transcriptional regulator